MAALSVAIAPASRRTTRLSRPVGGASGLLLRRGVQTLAAVLVAAIVAGVLFLTVLPRAGLYATYTVLSDSMQPAIPIGSIVIVAPADPESLVVGDVISYTSAQPPYPTLTHRIEGISREEDGRLGFKTKGDYNLVEDAFQVHYANKAGLVVASVPVVGFIMAGFTSPVARLALGLLFATALASFWFGAVWAKPRRQTPAYSAPRAAADAVPAGRCGLSLVRAGILAWMLVRLALGGRGVSR
jgi:signal peptidase I